jgi:hypothetical protein
MYFPHLLKIRRNLLPTMRNVRQEGQVKELDLQVDLAHLHSLQHRPRQAAKGRNIMAWEMNDNCCCLSGQ